MSEKLSVAAALEASSEYAVRGRFDDETLANLGQYWMGELMDPERTKREKGQIQIILGRLAFETQMRAERDGKMAS